MKRWRLTDREAFSIISLMFDHNYEAPEKIFQAIAFGAQVKLAIAIKQNTFVGTNGNLAIKRRFWHGLEKELHLCNVKR